MRRFRRFRLSGVGWIRWVLLGSAVGYLLLRLVEGVVLGPLAAIAETEARLRGIDALNRVVLGSVGRSIGPEQMVTYEKDGQGRIAAYHVNTKLINVIASEAASAVHNEFQEMAERDYDVPLGALSGSRFFAAQGPNIPVRMLPIGSVSIDIGQDFKAEGINQTRHRIWIHASARVRVILPVVSREIEVTTDLPLTETVIVGPVPN